MSILSMQMQMAEKEADTRSKVADARKAEADAERAEVKLQEAIFSLREKTVTAFPDDPRIMEITSAAQELQQLMEMVLQSQQAPPVLMMEPQPDVGPPYDIDFLQEPLRAAFLLSRRGPKLRCLKRWTAAISKGCLKRKSASLRNRTIMPLGSNMTGHLTHTKLKSALYRGS